MSNRFNAVIPVEGSDGKTRYTRVGTLWQNEKDGQTFFKLDLDFPVGATEILAFPPKSKDDE
ncbi:MAG: hypothetical protein ACRBBS_13035 [Thalassovita sp.]